MAQQALCENTGDYIWGYFHRRALLRRLESQQGVIGPGFEVLYKFWTKVSKKLYPVYYRVSLEYIHKTVESV